MAGLESGTRSRHCILSVSNRGRILSQRRCPAPLVLAFAYSVSATIRPPRSARIPEIISIMAGCLNRASGRLVQQSVRNNGRVASLVSIRGGSQLSHLPRRFNRPFAVAVWCCCREPRAIISGEVETSAIMSCRNLHVAVQEGPTVLQRPGLPSLLTTRFLSPLRPQLTVSTPSFSRLLGFAVSTNVRLALLVAVPGVSLLFDAPTACPLGSTRRRQARLSR